MFQLPNKFQLKISKQCAILIWENDSGKRVVVARPEGDDDSFPDDNYIVRTRFYDSVKTNRNKLQGASDEAVVLASLGPMFAIPFTSQSFAMN